MKNFLRLCIAPITRFRQRHPITFFLALVLGVPASLNYSGMCISQMRYLSDEEKIKIVVESTMKQLQLPINVKGYGTRYYNQIPYKSFEEFIQKNPNCCTTRGAGDVPPPTFWDRVWGDYAYDVISIHYKANFIDESGTPKSRSIEFSNILTNCGKIRW